ncbi:hypothetical protein ISCGN_011187 [Ixodes scapularis]
MEARQRHQGEQLDVYFYDKLAKARLCGLPDSVCVDYLIMGLNYEEAIRALSTQTFETPESLHEANGGAPSQHQKIVGNEERFGQVGPRGFGTCRPRFSWVPHEQNQRRERVLAAKISRSLDISP